MGMGEWRIFNCNMEHDDQVRLEDLTLGKELGAGAYGVVHKGEYLGLQVAVKILDQAQHDRMNYARSLFHECNVLRGLRHPNVVLFIGVQEQDGKLYIIEEFVEGGALLNKLQQEPNIPWKERLAMTIEIAQGLLYIHKKNILHRDLKSENVLLDKYGRAKLADFGLARQIGGSALPTGGGALRMTQEVGTMWWRAPEVDSREDYTKSADVFSFGILMSEIITAIPADDIRTEMIDMEKSKGLVFVVDSEKLRTIIPTSPSSSGCPQEWIDLVVECCSHESFNRPSMSDILSRLNAMLGQLDDNLAKIKEAIPNESWATSFFSMMPTTTSEVYIPVQSVVSLVETMITNGNRCVLSAGERAFVTQYVGQVLENPEHIKPHEYYDIRKRLKHVDDILFCDFVKPLYNSSLIYPFVTREQAVELIKTCPHPEKTMYIRVRGTPGDKQELAVTGHMNGKLGHGRLLIQPNGLVMGKTFARNWNEFLLHIQQRHGWEFFYPDVAFSSDKVRELFADTQEPDGYSEDF